MLKPRFLDNMKTFQRSNEIVNNLFLTQVNSQGRSQQNTRGVGGV